MKLLLDHKGVRQYIYCLIYIRHDRSNRGVTPLCLYSYLCHATRFLEPQTLSLVGWLSWDSSGRAATSPHLLSIILIPLPFLLKASALQKCQAHFHAHCRAALYSGEQYPTLSGSQRSGTNNLLPKNASHVFSTNRRPKTHCAGDLSILKRFSRAAIEFNQSEDASDGSPASHWNSDCSWDLPVMFASLHPEAKRCHTL